MLSSPVKNNTGGIISTFLSATILSLCFTNVSYELIRVSLKIVDDHKEALYGVAFVIGYLSGPILNTLVRLCLQYKNKNPE